MKINSTKLLWAVDIFQNTILIIKKRTSTVYSNKHRGFKYTINKKKKKTCSLRHCRRLQQQGEHTGIQETRRHPSAFSLKPQPYPILMKWSKVCQCKFSFTARIETDRKPPATNWLHCEPRSWLSVRMKVHTQPVTHNQAHFTVQLCIVCCCLNYKSVCVTLSGHHNHFLCINFRFITWFWLHSMSLLIFVISSKHEIYFICGINNFLVSEGLWCITHYIRVSHDYLLILHYNLTFWAERFLNESVSWVKF